MDALLIMLHLVVVMLNLVARKYATGGALVRGTFDWGVLDEKRTHPITDIEGPKRDFRPTSVILCRNSVCAVDYVETEA
jgi:hypothetical protein